MYSLSLLSSFFSVWCLYSASERVEYNKKGIALWLAAHGSISRFLSGCLFFLSILILASHIGLTIAILTSACMWIFVASATTLLAPFHRVKPLHLALIIGIIAAAEYLFHTFQI